MDEHTKSIHYLLMADHFMVQKALLSQIKDTELTMGQPKVLDYLKAHDFTKMEPGRYEIQGDDIFAQVFDAETKPAEEQRPEAHEKYADVQFLASGRERLGFTPDTGSYEVDERFDDRDLIFYKKVENECFIEARPGCYSVFFPEDIHRPACASGQPMTVRKVVIKISVKLL